jgi:hypothetical protein
MTSRNILNYGRDLDLSLVSLDLRNGFINGTAVTANDIDRLFVDAFETHRDGGWALGQFEIITGTHDFKVEGPDGRVLSCTLGADMTTAEYFPTGAVARTTAFTGVNGLGACSADTPDSTSLVSRGTILAWSAGGSTNNDLALSEDCGVTWAGYDLILSAAARNVLRARFDKYNTASTPTIVIDGVFWVSMDDGRFAVSHTGLDGSWVALTALPTVLGSAFGSVYHFDCFGGAMVGAADGVAVDTVHVVRSPRLALSRTAVPTSDTPNAGLLVYPYTFAGSGVAVDVRGLVANRVWGSWCLMTQDGTNRRLHISRDGIKWELKHTLTTSDDSARIHNLASVGSMLVAYSPDERTLVVSADGGDNWREIKLGASGVGGTLSSAHGGLFLTEHSGPDVDFIIRTSL